MFGPLDKAANKVLSDINPREILVLLPLAIMMFVMGIYPKPFLERMEPSVQALLDTKFSSQAVVINHQAELESQDLSYLISHE